MAIQCAEAQTSTLAKLVPPHTAAHKLGHQLQDGSFAQADSHESRNCRHALEMETGNVVQKTWRLDLGKSGEGGNPTALAWVSIQGAREAGASESGYFCAGRLAHSTAQLWNLDESQWRRPQDHPRASTPRNVQSHSRYVYASGHASETRTSCQNREADFDGRSRSKARHADNPIPYWTLTDPDSKRGVRISSLESWRPRRDLNPCYRRERAMS